MSKLIVIGGGIQGLAHALAAAKRGWTVTLVERNSQAIGASIRNFGMFWPIGQAPGLGREAALHGRSIWLEAAKGAGFVAHDVGSIHLATRADEWAVLEEFHAKGAGLGYTTELLTRDETFSRSPVAHRSHVMGGLFSPEEVNVDSREAIARIPAWLAEVYGVHILYGTPVVGIDAHRAVLADGRVLEADRIVLCPGDDLRTLFPGHPSMASIRLCKLQMLKTAAVPGFDMGPMIASGLTLQHYACFQHCTSLAALKRRIAEETPEINAYGIHVMASQFHRPGGGLIIGDSHEYGADITPFDKPEINQIIVRELKRIIELPSWDISETWSGVYAKVSDRLTILEEVAPDCWISVAPGGAGMTLSFGLADFFWQDAAMLLRRLAPSTSTSSH